MMLEILISAKPVQWSKLEQMIRKWWEVWVKQCPCMHCTDKTQNVRKRKQKKNKKSAICILKKSSQVCSTHHQIVILICFCICQTLQSVNNYKNSEKTMRSKNHITDIVCAFKKCEQSNSGWVISILVEDCRGNRISESYNLSRSFGAQL